MNVLIPQGASLNCAIRVGMSHRMGGNSRRERKRGTIWFGERVQPNSSEILE
jgi:hypothetical protein